MDVGLRGWVGWIRLVKEKGGAGRVKDRRHKTTATADEAIDSFQSPNHQQPNQQTTQPTNNPTNKPTNQPTNKQTNTHTNKQTNKQINKHAGLLR
jgi:hypothetical protein